MKILKSILLLFTSLLLFYSCQTKEEEQGEVSVMTFNLRYDNKGDSLNWWGYRKDSVLSFLQSQSPEVIGFQEVLHQQLQDLLAGLDGYQAIGVGRDDGDKEGEYVPILYDPNRLDLLDSGYFWLSATPQEPSFGWDAACHRVSTWAKLRHKESGQDFFFLNTHFDHQGDTARIKSADMVREMVAQHTVEGLPVIVVGDFNADPKSSVVLSLVTETHPGHLIDSYATAEKVNGGGEWTFHNFGRLPIEQRHRIDYIFYQGALSPLTHTTFQEEDREAKQYLSDHTPIMVSFRMQR